MKTAVVLLVLFVALAAANENCPIVKALQKGLDECKESLNPSDEILDLVAKDQGYDNREVNCFNACMAEKAELMKDSKMDIEKIESLLREGDNPNEDMIKAVVTMMTECKEEAEVSDDACDVAGLYSKCVNAKREAMKDDE